MRHARLGAGLLFILIPVLAQSQIMPTRPYESSDWNLAWRAFLGGGDIQAAYALARAAVAAQPRSVQWRHRLALAAEQSGHPGTALGAYDWLIMHAGQTEYLDKALNLASGLNDASRAVPLMLLALRLRPYSEERWIATLGELLKLGEYPRALRLLQVADRQHPRRFFLWEQVVLYQQMGEPGHELQTLDIYRRRYGPEPKVMLQIATLQYLQGDYQKAYTSLKAARVQATPQDTAYWRTLSGLAWLLEDYPVARQASEVLYKANTADPDDYRRLYLIHLASEPHRAFEIALAGWRHTHESSLFFAALSVANAANKPAWLRQAFTHLNKIDTQNLGQHPLYWTSLAMLHASQGRMALAQRAYAQAMALRPDDDRLWADDLWMLIDASDQTRLRALLPRLAAHAISRPALWAPLAAGFGLIGQPDDALPFLNRIWAKHSRDPAWLSDYADTIALAGYPQLAQRLRRAALQTLAVNPTEPANIGHRQRLLASLATHLLPGDPAYRWVARLARHPQDARAREQVLGWTLQNDDIGAAQSWQRQAYADTPIPAWARLSLALKTDDASTQAQLLSRDLNALPRQDAASAAEGLGWTPLATQLVFDGMRGTPNTDRWQQSFRPLALGGSDTLGATGSLMRASGLSVVGTRLSARHWLSSGLSLTGNIDAGMQSIYDHTQLGTIPGWSRQGSLNLTRTLPRGSASLSLGGDAIWTLIFRPARAGIIAGAAACPPPCLWITAPYPRPASPCNSVD
ncbi:hypothetical protein BI364_03210 [Acidihalobacter yilgarnensis]|uniref:Uncharacterized protein n=1 Tax=Acidihalobacter yilgarnensis TaxID=2819280 RepID=A0A1D8IKZ4_9GAMM|nr:tetratricopeptide repeat protein [Acidihalobacter yilgarnensis]AOU97142.1 hypothetical protein BI364_03210 [Acidihalobacter yilgarnensis]